MAQLDVQPKKSNPWWIWLLLAIVILALIFYFMRDRDGNSEVNNRNNTTAPNYGVAAADLNGNSLDREAPKLLMI